GVPPPRASVGERAQGRGRLPQLPPRGGRAGAAVAAPAGDGAVGPKSAGVPETRAHLRYGARLKPDEPRLRLAPGVGEVGLASDGEGEPAQRQRTNAAPRVLDYHGCLLTVGSAIRATRRGCTAAGCDPANPHGAHEPCRESQRGSASRSP